MQEQIPSFQIFLFIVDCLRLILIVLNYCTKILFMLITEVWGTPLNLGSASLVFPSSPSLDPGLEPRTWGPGCLGLHPGFATPSYVTTGTFLNFSVPSPHL